MTFPPLHDVVYKQLSFTWLHGHFIQDSKTVRYMASSWLGAPWNSWCTPWNSYGVSESMQHEDGFPVRFVLSKERSGE